MNWSPQLLEQIISHELGHISRGDWLRNIASRIVVCLFWINPLVWSARRRLMLECEKSCDDMAVDDTGCAISYAENLLWLANVLNFPRQQLASAFIGRQSPLMERIKHILLVDKKRHYIERNSVVPSLMLAIILTAPLSSMHVSIGEVDHGGSHQVLIPVKYFPKETMEFSEFMKAVGRI